MAMTAGDLGAAVADRWLDNPVAARVMCRRTEQDLRRAMKRISWLIYRINTPALRLMFMAPGNRFRMRDGLVSLLAGNLRGNWRLVVPVLAFKAVYYMVAMLIRVGLQPPYGGVSTPRVAAENSVQTAGK